MVHKKVMIGHIKVEMLEQFENFEEEKAREKIIKKEVATKRKLLHMREQVLVVILNLKTLPLSLPPISMTPFVMFLPLPSLTVNLKRRKTLRVIPNLATALPLLVPPNQV